MTCEEEPKICILKTHELLSKAEQLMCDIEELLKWCSSKGPSSQRWCRTVRIEAETQQEREATIEEEGEALVIDGFRFESAVSREDLRRLKSQARGRGGRYCDA